MATFPLKPRIPVINWSHPLAKGLVFDMPATEGGGSPIDIVTKLRGSNNSGVSWIKSPFGNALSYDGSTGKTTFTTIGSQNSLSQLSLQIISYPINKTSGGTFPRLFHKGPDARGYWDFSLDNGIAGFIWQGECTGNSAGQSGNVSLTLSSWYNTICISDGLTTGTGWRHWNNGIEPIYNAAAVGTAPRLADSSALAIGGRTTDTTRAFTGYIALIRFWNRILSPQEIKQLSVNPWIIYRKPMQDLT